MLDVILRTCSNVYTVHESASEVKHRATGPDVSKLEISLRCMNSLITSMNRVNDGLRLIIVDDHSDGLDKIKKLSEKCNHYTEIISLEDTGNGASMYTCFKYAKEFGRDLLFFVEDDYLHDITCIPEMIYEYDLFKLKLNHEVALFPYDNVELYMHPQKNVIPCNMGIGRNRHWRSTLFSTDTFLCSREILERYWYLFAMTKDYGKDSYVDESTTVNVIWNAPYKGAGGAFLLSPIPALAVHLHFKEHLSPFVDWESWWDRNALDDNEYQLKKEDIVKIDNSQSICAPTDWESVSSEDNFSNSN